MIVHFMASGSKITNYIDDYRQIIDVIQSEGHTLAADWVESSYERAEKGIRLDVEELRKVYAENIAALAKADVFITEATHPSFGTGYQIGRSKKPTLILRKEDAPASLIAGITEKHIELKEYNTDTLEKIVKGFLLENDIATKDLRFNFSIDRRIYNYLRWASYKTGKTKAEIIRSLIEHEIDLDGDED